MSLFLDALTVIVFIVVIFHAFKRGLIRALIELAGFAAAFAVAYLLSNPAGQWIANTFLNKFVSGSITQLAASSGKSNAAFFTKLVGSLPGIFEKTLTGINANLGTLGAKAMAELVKAVSMPLASLISRGIAFFVILAVCLVVVGMVAHLSDTVARMPVIGVLNSLAGAGVGILEALIIMFFISTLLALIISLMALQKNPPISVSTINSTQIYKYINNINPLTGMLLKK
jgi:uncharacterized membrane protein required for colicin V production